MLQTITAVLLNRTYHRQTNTTTWTFQDKQGNLYVWTCSEARFFHTGKTYCFKGSVSPLSKRHSQQIIYLLKHVQQTKTVPEKLIIRKEDYHNGFNSR